MVGRMKHKSMRTAFVVFFALLTLLFMWVTWPFAKSAFLAFTFAIIFFPVYRYARGKTGINRYVVATAVTLLIGVCVVIPLVVLGTVFVTKIATFLQDFSAQLTRGSFSETFQQVVAFIHDIIYRVTDSAPSAEDISASLTKALQSAGMKFYEFSPKMLSTTISIIVNFLLMLLFLVVFLAEGETLETWLMETVPLSSAHWKELARDVRISITSSIIAAVVIAVIQGVFLGLGFKVAGFQHVIGWSLVAIFLSLIPVVGASSCYITASILLFASGDGKGAILFLVYGFGFISVIDNFIRPVIVRSSSRMHPLLIFVTLIGAVRLLGPIGLLVGPVLLAIFLSSLRIYRREFANTLNNVE